MHVIEALDNRGNKRGRAFCGVNHTNELRVNVDPGRGASRAATRAALHNPGRSSRQDLRFKLTAHCSINAMRYLLPPQQRWFTVEKHH